MIQVRAQRLCSVFAGFVLLALPGCTNDDVASRQPWMRTGSGDPTKSGKEGSWQAVVFEANRDVFVYDRSAKVSRNLTQDGQRVDQTSPKFIDENTVAFSEEGTLVAVPWKSREPRRAIARVAYAAWDAFDGRVAGLVLSQTKAGKVTTGTLEVRTTSNGRVLWRTALFSLSHSTPGAENAGSRELAGDDERRVEWAPDGKTLLVSYTDFYPQSKPTLFVITEAGKVSVKLDGTTFARWLGPRRLIYRSFEASDWWNFDIARRTKSILGTGLGSGSPAVDPVTRRIAFDLGRGWWMTDARRECQCSVVVLDAVGGRGRMERRFAVSPLWLSDGQLAMTIVQKCQRPRCSSASAVWATLGESSVHQLADRRELAILPFDTFPYATEGLSPYQGTDADVLRT